MSASIYDVRRAMFASISDIRRPINEEEKVVQPVVPAFRSQGDIERSVPVYIVPSRIEHPVEQQEQHLEGDLPVADMVWR